MIEPTKLEELIQGETISYCQSKREIKPSGVFWFQPFHFSKVPSCFLFTIKLKSIQYNLLRHCSKHLLAVSDWYLIPPSSDKYTPFLLENYPSRLSMHLGKRGFAYLTIEGKPDNQPQQEKQIPHSQWADDQASPIWMNLKDVCRI